MFLPNPLCILPPHPSPFSTTSSFCPSSPSCSIFAQSLLHRDRSTLHICLFLYGSHRICKRDYWFGPICVTNFEGFLCWFCNGRRTPLLFFSTLWLFLLPCLSHIFLPFLSSSKLLSDLLPWWLEMQGLLHWYPIWLFCLPLRCLWSRRGIWPIRGWLL